jgi:hypothetical protein
MDVLQVQVRALLQAQLVLQVPLLAWVQLVLLAPQVSQLHVV